MAVKKKTSKKKTSKKRSSKKKKRTTKAATGTAKKKTTRKKKSKKKAGTRKKRAVNKTARKKTTRRSPGKSTGRRGPKSKLSNVSLDALRAEFDRRVQDLERERTRLRSELETVDAEIASIQGFQSGARSGAKRSTTTTRAPRGTAARRSTSGRGRGGRARNENSLVESLKTLLKTKTLSVTDMAAAVQKAGYRTTSPNFRTIVNQTLIKNPKMFRRVSRGQYTAR